MDDDPIEDDEGAGWKPGDPCGVCGSTNTGEDIVEGGYCNDCGSSDADE